MLQTILAEMILLKIKIKLVQFLLLCNHDSFKVVQRKITKDNISDYICLLGTNYCNHCQLLWDFLPTDIYILTYNHNVYGCVCVMLTLL
jgi:hypothetical protein